MQAVQSWIPAPHNYARDDLKTPVPALNPVSADLLLRMLASCSRRRFASPHHEVITSRPRPEEHREGDASRRMARRKDMTSSSREVNTSEFNEMIAFRQTEGAGNAGARTEPAASRAKVKSTRVSHHRFAEHSGIPCAMVLTGCFVLSPVIGLCCHRPRAMRKHCRKLMSASRHQDHTTSPSVASALVFSHQQRPPHPAPNVRDDREAPLFRARDAKDSAGDLPVATTRRGCGRLARRANQSRHAKLRQAA